MKRDDTMISMRTALVLASLWVGAVVFLVNMTLLWGGTVVRCKTGGYTSGAVFRATDADCLDTRVLNEFNSQISDSNIKGGAAIQGSKIDGVFASLISTNQIIVAAPGLVLSSLGSSTGLISIAAMAVITGGIRLQSNHDFTVPLGIGAVPTPFIPNSLYANFLPKAMALVSASSSNGEDGFAHLNVLASLNIGLVSHMARGVYLVSLLIPMGSDYFFPFATPMKMGAGTLERNLFQTDTTLMISFYPIVAAFNDLPRRKYFQVHLKDNAATVDNSFSLIVFGQ